jgi:AcrR family transcriptional regulator
MNYNWGWSSLIWATFGYGRLRMNGHDRRKQRIKERIKTSALELFTSYGADRVSMDAIAARANVSKVTIYKYFHSKEYLQREIINHYVDEILAATQKVLDSDLEFTEKLKITLVAQLNSLKVAGSQALFDLLEGDSQSEGNEEGGLKNRIREIMYCFYEQGKKEGYIDESLSFELLYLFSEIFQAGFKAKWMDYKADPVDSETLEQLVHLCFYGMMRRT